MRVKGACGAHRYRFSARNSARNAGLRFAFCLPLALYLTLTLYQVALPGPNYDEAVEAKAAVQILAGLPVEAHRDAVIAVGNVRLPLMIVDYVGSLNTYALLAFLRLGSIVAPGANGGAVDVAMMRLWPILVGAAVLWLTWRLGLHLAGPRAAMVAALALAVHPSFVFFARQGIYVTNTTIAFSLAILLALGRLAATNRRRWWYGAMFLAGLGLWAKFIMLWPLAATVILAWIGWVGRRHLGFQPAAGFNLRRLLQPQAVLLALIAFLLGLSPLILFNVQTGATIAHFLGTLGQSYYGVQNTAYLANLATRWEQLQHFLAGDHFWYLGGNFVDLLARPLWLLGLALAAIALLFGAIDRFVKPKRPVTHESPSIRQSVPRRALGAYLFVLLLLLQTPLTPTSLWYTHLALFSPFLALSLALGWESLASLLPSRMGWALAGALIVALGFSSLRADWGYHQALAASGGYADHADASYRLTGALLAEGATTPYALDWGFDAPLILLSRGRVNPIEIFGYERVDAPDPGFNDRLRPLLHAENIFLVHAPDRTNFPGRREALEALAAEMGVQGSRVNLESVAIVRERSGAPHTEILRTRP